MGNATGKDSFSNDLSHHPQGGEGPGTSGATRGPSSSSSARSHSAPQHAALDHPTSSGLAFARQAVPPARASRPETEEDPVRKPPPEEGNLSLPSSSEASSGQPSCSDQVEALFGGLDTVPLVLRWEGGGDEVYVTGTFVNWSEKVAMSRSGNDFVLIQEMSRAKHLYKFIVDDEWRFSPEEPNLVDRDGNLNNFIDLQDFKPKLESLGEINIETMHKKFLDAPYGGAIPDINEYVKEPPPLPPHLRHIVLTPNVGSPSQHVTLDHLYCTARKDGLMVLGISQRLREKIVTVVYYSPVQGGFPVVLAKKTTALAGGGEKTSIVPTRQPIG